MECEEALKDVEAKELKLRFETTDKLQWTEEEKVVSKLAAEEVSVSEVVDYDAGPRSASADTPVMELEKEEEMTSKRVKLKLATEEGVSASEVVDSDVEPRSTIVNTPDSSSGESYGIPANPICSVSRESQSLSALKKEFHDCLG